MWHWLTEQYRSYFPKTKTPYRYKYGTKRQMRYGALFMVALWLPLRWAVVAMTSDEGGLGVYGSYRVGMWDGLLLVAIGFLIGSFIIKEKKKPKENKTK